MLPMLNDIKQKILRMTGFWKTEGTVSVAGRIYRRLRKPPTPPLLCHIDFPTSDKLHDLEMEIYGWAVSLMAKVERVEAFIDDQLTGDIKYGLERPDVLDVLPELSSSRVGFGGTFLLNAKHDSEERQLLVRVWDTAGNLVEIRRQVKVSLTSANKIAVPTFDFYSAWLNDCASLERSSVSIIIPTLNPGHELPTLLSSLKSQEGCENVEIIVVDSGSQDGTVELARDYGAKVIEIAPRDFSHSAARNLGAEAATGDYLLFMTQDALPGSRRFLYEMIQAARASGAVAVTPAESLREDVDLFYCVSSHNHNRFLALDSGDRVTGAPQAPDYETVRKHCQLNDVACLIEREVFAQYRFRRNYAEDLDLGMRLTAAGYKLALLSSTRVIHSHNRPAYYHLRRGFVDTVSLAKMFPDFPLLPTTSLPALSRGVVFSYRNLTHCINVLGDKLQFPCPTTQFLAAIEEHWNNQTPEINPVESLDVDDRYREFLTRLAVDFSTSEKDDSDDAAITDAVNDKIRQIKQHLNSIYESVDQALFTEFKQAVFKSHAISAGMLLASYFLSSPANDDATVRLERELRQGV